MKNGTFLQYERPLLVCMAQADDPARIRELIDLSRPEGAEAFGMQFCRLRPEFWSEQTFRDLFAYTKGLPVYVTNYRYGYNEGKSDEELARSILQLADYGATLCAAVANDNVVGCQFHPEKSGAVGLSILRAFAEGV